MQDPPQKRDLRPCFRSLKWHGWVAQPAGLQGGLESMNWIHSVVLWQSSWDIWAFFQFLFWLVDIHFYLITDHGHLASQNVGGTLALQSALFFIIWHQLHTNEVSLDSSRASEQKKSYEKILSCGGLSFLALAITQIKNGSGLWKKKVIIKKYMLACIFPNHQASLPIPKKRRDHVMLSFMSGCRIMPTSVFQRLLWFSCQRQTIISCSFLPPQILTSRNVK